MPKGPALYDPLKYPDRVRQRRNIVLSLMADQGYITAAQAARGATLTDCHGAERRILGVLALVRGRCPGSGDSAPEFR